MSDEQQPSAEQVLEQAVVRKRCPLDGAVLIHTTVDGIPGWECPECSYFEPDPL